MDQVTKPAGGLFGLPETDAARAREGIRSMLNTRLVISRELFTATMTGLRDRSAGWRESAATWAGHVLEERDWIVEQVHFHHELCDDFGGPLSLELSEEAKFALYQELAKEGLRLIGLVHTHPTGWVDLGEIDQRNQLSSRVGFWSLVVPTYARKPWAVVSMGIHVRMDNGWHRLGPAELSSRVCVR
jgi:proteasome lid subunit RPN8/RPN11